MNKRNKQKKRKNSSLKEDPKRSAAAKPILPNRTDKPAEGIPDEVTVKLGKSKKRKLSIKPDELQEEASNEKDASVQKKKKKLTRNDETAASDVTAYSAPSRIGENSESTKPKTFSATENFLSLIAKTDTIVHESGKGFGPSNKTDAASAKRAAKRAAKIEKRAREKQAKALKKVSAESAAGAPESIEDRNIRNKKLKDRSLKLVGSQEEMEAKRPRLDDKNAMPHRKKRAQSITPDREIFSGYKFKDLSEKQKATFYKLREQRLIDKWNAPKLLLQNFANYSSMVLDDVDRTPLTLCDVQHFLIYSLHLQRSTGNLPTWVSLKNPNSVSKNVCIIVDGVSLSDYVNNEKHLPVLKSFRYQMEVITPYAYGGDFLTEFLHVPLTRTQRLKLTKKLGSCKEACLAGEAFETVQRIYPAGSFRPRGKITSSGLQSSAEESGVESADASTPIVTDSSLPISPPSEDKFPRTELLLRSWDLLKERVPVPFAQGQLAHKYRGFVQTKDTYDEVTDQSPIWAVDCEMCMTKVGNELTRISVINENFEVVYESLVKPYNPITNYLTQYSGITRKDLENVWTRIEDVHEDLRNLLPSDVILAGHSIGCDLLAMKMFHPYVIDTSCIFNLSGVRPHKTKLKTLMAELLHERIQEGGASGHDSVEDAASCLKLIKTKLARSIEWGDAVLGGKRSEEESVIAQQALLRKDRDKRKPTIYPVAKNSIIRCGPRSHQTVQSDHHQPSWGPQKERYQTKPMQYGPSRASSGYEKTVYSKPIFTHLAHGEKSVLVVGDEKFVNAGQELLRSNVKLNSPDSRLQFSVRQNSEVLSYGCEKAPSNGITLLHLSSDENSDPKTVIHQADKLIGEALKKLKHHHSLITILLTGRRSDVHDDSPDPHDNHGLFMMKVIKPAYVPLTIEDISETCS